MNCAFVDNCTAYHVVEAKHGQPHVAEKPIFIRSACVTCAEDSFEAVRGPIGAGKLDRARSRCGADTG